MNAEHIRVGANGQRFCVAAAGPVDGPPVMLLHGFPETSHAWSHQIDALAQAGLRVLAPYHALFVDRAAILNALHLATLPEYLARSSFQLGRCATSAMG